MTPDLAFNTAVSFMTNTNWQSYSPDTTMSYLTQMAALAVQNFVSAAVGIAIAVALIRGFARHTTKTIGNFWADVDPLHAVHSAADLRTDNDLLCVAGMHPELQGARDGADA